MRATGPTGVLGMLTMGDSRTTGDILCDDVFEVKRCMYYTKKSRG